MKTKKEIRHCTATGKEMIAGWVVNDGEEYYSTEELALKKCKELGYKSIEEAYEDDVCYWTEWEN